MSGTKNFGPRALKAHLAKHPKDTAENVAMHCGVPTEEVLQVAKKCDVEVHSRSSRAPHVPASSEFPLKVAGNGDFWTPPPPPLGEYHWGKFWWEYVKHGVPANSPGPWEHLNRCLEKVREVSSELDALKLRLATITRSKLYRRAISSEQAFADLRGKFERSESARKASLARQEDLEKQLRAVCERLEPAERIASHAESLREENQVLRRQQKSILDQLEREKRSHESETDGLKRSYELKLEDQWRWWEAECDSKDQKVAIFYKEKEDCESFFRRLFTEGEVSERVALLNACGNDSAELFRRVSDQEELSDLATMCATFARSIDRLRSAVEKRIPCADTSTPPPARPPFAVGLKLHESSALISGAPIALGLRLPVDGRN